MSVLARELFSWSKPSAKLKTVSVPCCYGAYNTETQRVSVWQRPKRHFLTVFGEILGLYKCLMRSLLRSFKAQICTKGKFIHSNTRLASSGLDLQIITLGISVLKLLLHFIDNVWYLLNDCYVASTLHASYDLVMWLIWLFSHFADEQTEAWAGEEEWFFKIRLVIFLSLPLSDLTTKLRSVGV